MGKFMNGEYRVINRSKYKGDLNNVIYRSSWEMSYMFKLDTDVNVIEWSSEELIIPYRDVNGVVRRYFTDFKVKRKVGDQIITEIIEIKPYKETIPPVLSEGAKTKTKIRQILTWDVNSRKWEAARKFCDRKGWIFKIVTEKDMPGVGRK